MQRNGATPSQNAAPFSSPSFFNYNNTLAASSSNTLASSSESRHGRESSSRNLLHKDPERSRDRRPSFGRKPSFGSPGRSSRRRASSPVSANGPGNPGGGGNPAGINVVVTDKAVPPALPDFALQLAAAAKLSRETPVIQSPASADSFSKMLNRTAPTPVNGFSQLAPPAPVVPGQPPEAGMVHQHIHELSSKRISTLDYLRKA